MRDFVPHPLLRNAHLMTIAGALLPRRTPLLPPAKDRRFATEPGTQVLAKCHWQPRPADAPTLVLVHGLEGSSNSPYLRSLAERGFIAGFNVLRMNQRNCGGTEHLTPTLYNSGLSVDFRDVLEALIGEYGLHEIFFAGYSMGGNLVLKMTGELGSDAPRQLRGVCAVCPVLDLAACVDALERPSNALYEWNFVRNLKSRLRRKAEYFPGRFKVDGLRNIRTVRQFDDLVTAPHGGYANAADYYYRAAAARVVDKIAVPTLIITSQDDPFVPFESFRTPGLASNPNIRLLAPAHGGHCSFISATGGGERFWAEARIVEFCRERA